MTRTFAEKLAPNADLKTVLETCAREIAEETRSTLCQICLSNSFDPETSLIYEFKATEEEVLHANKLILPLMTGRELLGTITIAGPQQQNLDETGQLRVALVELAARIYKAQTADVVQRETFQKTFLTEIDNVMSYSMGVGDALFVIVNILGKVLKASRCIFVCTDEAQTGWKSYEYWVHDQVQSCQSFGWPPNDSALVAQTLLAKEPIMIYATAAGSFHTPAQRELQHLDVLSFLGIPLRNEKGVYGCVMLQQCNFRRQWKPDDLDMLQTAADTVAKGFLAVSAEKFAREPIMQLHHQNIHTYKDQKSGQKNIDAVRRSLKGVRGDAAAPATAPPPKVEAPSPLPAPPPSPKVEAAPPKVEAPKAEAPTRKAEATPEKKEAPKISHRKQPEPAAVESKPEVESTKRVLSKEDEEYIFATPDIDTRTLNRIAGWINQIEANDKYANGHAVPVAKFAVATAQQLGLPKEEIDTLRLAALVRDIGKMSISGYILQKEDEDLSDTELLISMKHPQDGADLLESFPELARAAPIVRAHHEEYDGNGFPIGIKGDEIILTARILSVANAYHVMISPRKSEVKPASVHSAQENLRKGAGSQYDPRVVEALLRALKKQAE